MSNDNWSSVTSIQGFLGDEPATSITAIDPQTILVPNLTIDVIANQTAPNTNSTGGVAEFEIADPTIALQGSGTADYPNIIIYLNTTGCSNIRLKYDLRDIDGATDNAIQPMALQYRIGNAGNFVNIPAGFVADASTGPSLATLITSIDLILPSECNNQSELQLRMITTNAAGSDEWIGIDNIDISKGSDTNPPTPAFNPKNGDVSVAITIVPVITFDEAAHKTDGSELVNADLASLIIFKKTSSTGTDVPFTATIDATKKIINITPSSSLEKSNYYYLAVGPVEDALGNESTLKSAIFSTVSTGSITVTYPNGGEVMYSGDLKTITWTTTNFDAGELVRVEVWAIDEETGLYEWIVLDPGTANDGEYQVTVGPNAPYGTGYIIKLSGVTNLAADSSDSPFTIIATANNMAALRANPANSVIRFDGEAIISFIRSNRNQKYLQDATGGLLIDDASGVLTTVLAQGDKITSLEGTLGYFSGVLQLVPKKATVTVVSTGNNITPASMTLASYVANHIAFQSMLIKLTNVWFPAADGSAMFAAATNYTLTEGTNNIEFRTFNATETDIDGMVIPVQHLDLTGIGGLNGTAVQIYSRTIADLSVITQIEKNREKNVTIYPIPATSVLNVKNIQSVNTIEVLDITGKVVIRMDNVDQNEVRIPVGNLRKGMYFIKLTTPEGKTIKRFIKQ
jgi:hypothetical protein